MERAIGVALVYIVHKRQPIRRVFIQFNIRAIAGSDKRYKFDVKVFEIFDNNISTGSKTGIKELQEPVAMHT